MDILKICTKLPVGIFTPPGSGGGYGGNLCAQLPYHVFFSIYFVTKTSNKAKSICPIITPYPVKGEGLAQVEPKNKVCSLHLNHLWFFLVLLLQWGGEKWISSPNFAQHLCISNFGKLKLFPTFCTRFVKQLKQFIFFVVFNVSYRNKSDLFDTFTI